MNADRRADFSLMKFCMRRLEDFLQPGRTLVAAGYILYSSSTVMVLSRKCDDGVHVFNLDPTLGEYVMTRVCPTALRGACQVQLCSFSSAELEDSKQAQDNLLRELR